MQECDEEWLALTAGDQPPTRSTLADTVISIYDLPGFEELERKILLYSSARGDLSPELENSVNELSRSTFGIAREDTLFILPLDYDNLHEASPKRFAVERKWDEHEDQFETGDATDDEAVAILARLGMDFADKRGKPMLCIKLFCRQAEAAAKGIMGEAA